MAEEWIMFEEGRCVIIGTKSRPRIAYIQFDDNPGKARDDGRLLVKACKSYRDNIKTIESLKLELEASTSRLEAVIRSDRINKDMKLTLVRQMRYNNAALARAKERTKP